MFLIMEYTFGADKVFKWALYSMPFLLVWCLLTEKKKLIKWVLLGNVTFVYIDVMLVYIKLSYKVYTSLKSFLLYLVLQIHFFSICTVWNIT
jgi:hypothetical protein